MADGVRLMQQTQHIANTKFHSLLPFRFFVLLYFYFISFYFSFSVCFLTFILLFKNVLSNRLFTIYLFFIGTIIVSTLIQQIEMYHVAWTSLGDLLFGFCFSDISFYKFLTFRTCNTNKTESFHRNQFATSIKRMIFIGKK